jgi:hypothetical protein
VYVHTEGGGGGVVPQVRVATPGKPKTGVPFVTEYEFASMKCGKPSFGTVNCTVSVPIGPVKV